MSDNQPAEANPELAALSFEEALQALQATVAELESGEHSLEASLKLYERGQKMVALCTKRLEDAALRVEQLSETGEIVELSSE